MRTKGPYPLAPAAQRRKRRPPLLPDGAAPARDLATPATAVQRLPRPDSPALFTSAKGAGGHLEGLGQQAWNQYIFDWLDAALPLRRSSAVSAVLPRAAAARGDAFHADPGMPAAGEDHQALACDADDERLAVEDERVRLPRSAPVGLVDGEPLSQVVVPPTSPVTSAEPWKRNEGGRFSTIVKLPSSRARRLVVGISIGSEPGRRSGGGSRIPGA